MEILISGKKQNILQEPVHATHMIDSVELKNPPN